MADFWDDYEISKTGARRGTEQRFYGERVCSILDAQVDEFAPHYDPALGATGYWPGTMGYLRSLRATDHLAALQARLTEFRLPARTQAGRRELILIYREPTPAEALIPGRAVLYVDLGGTASKLYKELAKAEGENDLRVIEGPVDNKPAQRWVVIKGSNSVLTPGASVRVRTVAEASNLPTLWGMLEKYNAHVLPHFMHAPAKSLKFVGCKLGGTLINRKYWTLDYFFLYHDDGWDKACTVQKFEKLPVAVGPVDTDAAAVVGRQAVLIGWKKVGDEQTRNISRGGTSFSQLDAMLAWYQG